MAGRRDVAARGVWAEGSGWDQNLWPGREFPDARILDQRSSRSAGRRAPGRRPCDVGQPGRAQGRSHRRGDGGSRRAGASCAAPTARRPGVLVDNAMALIRGVLPAADGGRPRAALPGRRGRPARRAGLTEIQDASGYDQEQIAVLESLAAKGQLPIRVYATVSPEQMLALLREGHAHRRRVGLPDGARRSRRTPTAPSAAAEPRCWRTTRMSRASAA